MRQERRERIDTRRIGRWVVLVEAVDQDHQALAARQKLALRDTLEHRGQPGGRVDPRVGVRLAQGREPLLDLRHQRADQLRRIVPVVLPPANEVVRHHGAGPLVPREPRREQRALAHSRPAGHHDPAIRVVCGQELIEPGQQHLAADEALVALPLDAVVKALPGHVPEAMVPDNADRTPPRRSSPCAARGRSHRASRSAVRMS